MLLSYGHRQPKSIFNHYIAILLRGRQRQRGIKAQSEKCTEQCSLCLSNTKLVLHFMANARAFNPCTLPPLNLGTLELGRRRLKYKQVSTVRSAAYLGAKSTVSKHLEEIVKYHFSKCIKRKWTTCCLFHIIQSLHEQDSY